MKSYILMKETYLEHGLDSADIVSASLDIETARRSMQSEIESYSESLEEEDRKEALDKRNYSEDWMSWEYEDITLRIVDKELSGGIYMVKAQYDFNGEGGFEELCELHTSREEAEMRYKELCDSFKETHSEDECKEWGTWEEEERTLFVISDEMQYSANISISNETPFIK